MSNKSVFCSKGDFEFKVVSSKTSYKSHCCNAEIGIGIPKINFFVCSKCKEKCSCTPTINITLKAPVRTVNYICIPFSISSYS